MKKINRIIKGLMIMLFAGIAAFGFGGCTGGETDKGIQSAASTSTAAANSYEQISAEQAKKLMDTETDYVIIDARTEEEFNEGHIKNAVLIPEYEISERAEGELPGKDRLILVYCRSGRRSKIAAEALAALGYTNVKEFGGIIDWKYETVK